MARASRVRPSGILPIAHCSGQLVHKTKPDVNNRGRTFHTQNIEIKHILSYGLLPIYLPTKSVGRFVVDHTTNQQSDTRDSGPGPSAKTAARRDRRGTRSMNAQQLLQEISDYCRQAGLAESTFGRRAVNDGKLANRLRNGGRIT